MTQLAAKDVIFTLGMKRHPEGGWYAETFVDGDASAGRPRSTAIYYLLEAGDASHWHRVDAVEVWHYYAGAPLALRISDGKSVDLHMLGSDLDGGERPQVVVPKQAWQAAVSTGAFTLVGCTVAPGFQFSGFELADKNWAPGGD
ncbi:MAG: cupin protein [Devosia sp.]|uniref:cupin domain-containing protein n=1 Tax=Devosia sp. TaxID=1871048 RepID=UPI00261ACCE3|nr:cupin domain-containing protein [Devosia sp.]MDB5531269.1 cupin protein [Devosia sp.]